MNLTITYIHHSAFLARTPECTMLFDYFRGTLPEIRRDRPLYIFASHAHSDHFSPVIFRLKDAARQVRYILSDDIPLSGVPEALREVTVFTGPGMTLRDALLEVRTFRSTDQGVAFLVRCGNHVIYHAGDLNDWYWDGDAEDEAQEKVYLSELRKIRDTGFAIDAAMVPLDPRLGTYEYRGMEAFMETVGARKVFPMHFWGDTSVADRLSRSTVSDGWRDRLVLIHREGETWEV